MTIFEIFKYIFSKLFGWIVLGLIGAILVGGYSYVAIPKKYSAQSTVTITSGQYTASQALAIQKLVQSDPIVRATQNKLASMSEFSASAGTVGTMLGASVDTGTPNIAITATSTNPRLALKTNEIATSQLLKSSPTYVQGVPLAVLSKPKVNSSYVYPNTKHYILFGFLIGFVVAILFSIKRDFFSKKVKDARSLGLRLELDNLGSINLEQREEQRRSLKRRN